MPPRGTSTPRSRAASRENGKAGAKHGKKGGRPRGALPAEMLEQLGEPPIDKPLKLARWWTRALALIASLQLKGVKGVDELGRRITALAAAAGKVLPHDIIFTAAATVKDDEEDQAADAGAVIEKRTTTTDEPRRSRSVRSDPS